MRVSVCCFVFFMVSNVLAQPLVAEFSMPATACLEENVHIVNQSIGAESFEWDFCSGDLDLTPTASVLTNGFGGYGGKVELSEQNGNYYGFFLGRASGKLYRLDFGADVTSTPLIVNLGGLGVNSDSWRAIGIAKENGQYFGFIIDRTFLYRISFGSSLVSLYPGVVPALYSP